MHTWHADLPTNMYGNDRCREILTPMFTRSQLHSSKFVHDVLAVFYVSQMDYSSVKSGDFQSHT